MHRLRQRREAKALAFLRGRPLPSSALQIGTAALSGEPRACDMPRRAKTAIGLSIAVELVRRRLAKPTPDNRFIIAEPLGLPT
jgi:hypothetical protein